MTVQVVLLSCTNEMESHGSVFMMCSGDYDFNKVRTWKLTDGTSILIY